MTINTILKKSSELLKKCAEEGTSSHIGDIDEFIAFCEETIESVIPAKKYGLAITCERELKYWHYKKSLETGENNYQISAFLISNSL